MPHLRAPHDVGPDALAHPDRRGLLGVANQVRVARRRRDLLVSEQPPDHGQALTQRKRPAGVGMPEIMDSHVVDTRARPDGPPVVIEVREAAPSLLCGDHPGVSRRTGDRVEHVQGGRRHGNHARTRLGVPQPQLARRTVHVVPAQVQYLATPASGQHEQPDSRERRRPHRSLRFPQDPAQAPVFLGCEEPLTRAHPVAAQPPARVAPGRSQLPCFRQREHTREHVDHGVRHPRRFAKPVVQCRYLGCSDLAYRHRAQSPQDVVIQYGVILRDRDRLAVRPGINAHETLGQSGHGELRHGRSWLRLLAALDAVDDGGRLLPRLIGRDIPVPAERHAFGTSGPPGLHYVDLLARGVDPHPEAGQVPVPEDRILPFDFECVDGSLEELELASFRHAPS